MPNNNAPVRRLRKMVREANDSIMWLPDFCVGAIVRWPEFHALTANVVYSKARVTEAYIQHYRRQSPPRSELEAACDAELNWADQRTRVVFVD